MFEETKEYSNDWFIFELEEGLVGRGKTKKELVSKYLNGKDLDHLHQINGKWVYHVTVKQGRLTPKQYYIYQGEECAVEDGWVWDV